MAASVTREQIAAATAAAIAQAERALKEAEEAAHEAAVAATPPLLRLPVEMLEHIVRMLGDDGHRAQRPRFVHRLNADLREVRTVCTRLAQVVGWLIDPRRASPLGRVAHTARLEKPDAFAKTMCKFATGFVKCSSATGQARIAAFAASPCSLRRHIDAVLYVSSHDVPPEGFNIDTAAAAAAPRWVDPAPQTTTTTATTTTTTTTAAAELPAQSSQPPGAVSVKLRAALSCFRSVGVDLMHTAQYADSTNMLVASLAALTPRPVLGCEAILVRGLRTRALHLLWQLRLRSRPFNDAAAMASATTGAAGIYTGLRCIVLIGPHNNLDIAALRHVVPEVYPTMCPDGITDLDALTTRGPAYLEGYTEPGCTIAAKVLARLFERSGTPHARMLTIVDALADQYGATAFAALLAEVGTAPARLGLASSADAAYTKLLLALISHGAPLSWPIVRQAIAQPGVMPLLPPSALQRHAAERSNARTVVESLLCAGLVPEARALAATPLGRLDVDDCSGFNIARVVDATGRGDIERRQDVDAFLRDSLSPAYFVTGPQLRTRLNKTVVVLTPLETAFATFCWQKAPLLRVCAIAKAHGHAWRNCRWLLGLLLGSKVRTLCIDLLEELVAVGRPNLEALLVGALTAYDVAVRCNASLRVQRLLKPASRYSAEAPGQGWDA